MHGPLILCYSPIFLIPCSPSLPLAFWFLRRLARDGRARGIEATGTEACTERGAVELRAHRKKNGTPTLFFLVPPPPPRSVPPFLPPFLPSTPLDAPVHVQPPFARPAQPARPPPQELESSRRQPTAAAAKPTLNRSWLPFPPFYPVPFPPLLPARSYECWCVG